MKKEYDIRNALATIVMHIGMTSETPDVREILSAETDIPEELLDRAAEEIGSLRALGPVVVLAAMVAMSVGRAPTHEELLEAIPNASFVDDGKGEMRGSVEVVDEDDETLATADFTTKLN